MAVAVTLMASACSGQRGTEAGFWFEPVTFQSRGIGGA